MKSFEKLENRYRLTGALVLCQAAHVGCGEGKDLIDSLFVRDGSGKRFIPGSSLRGALRSTAERLMGSLAPGKTCLLDAGTSTKCPTSNEENRKVFQEMVKKQEKQGKQGKEKVLFEFLQNHLCDTCKVFGSPFMASRVGIADLYPQNGNPDTQERHGVGISRDTETAAAGVLFCYEVVDREEKFKFELWAENMEDTDLGVLGLGLLEMMNGDFWVGAKAAAGLGQCRLEEQGLKLEYFEDIEGLRHYLKEGKFLQSETGAGVKEFIKQRVETLIGSL